MFLGGVTMNVVDAVFSKLRQNKVAAKSSVWQTYKNEILLPLSDGIEIDAEQCENLLVELGKTESDLRNDLEVLSKRREWRQRLDAASGAASVINASESQLQALDEAFAEQRRKYLAKRQPIESQLRDASEKQMAAVSCDMDMKRTIQDVDLLARMETNRARLAELNQKIGPLVEQLGRNVSDGRQTIKFKIDSIENEIEQLTSNRSVKEIADNLLRYTTGDRSGSDKKRRVAELQERLEPLYSQRDELEKELASLRGQLRDAEQEQKTLMQEALVP
jgi:hypothetical protein